LKDFLYVVVSLIGVLGLFIMLAIGLRKLTKRVSVTVGGKLRILDRANIGRDSVILVISVCGKLMLIGVSGQSVQKLAELDMSEEEYSAVAVPENSGFFDVFSGFLKKKEIKEEKENKQEENESQDEQYGKNEDEGNA